MDPKKDTVKEEVHDESWHSCPFQEDINNNPDFKCNCSPEQTRQCAGDI